MFKFIIASTNWVILVSFFIVHGLCVKKIIFTANIKIRFPCNYQYLLKHESCFVLFPPSLVVLFCIKTTNRIHGTDIFAYL